MLLASDERRRGNPAFLVEREKGGFCQSKEERMPQQGLLGDQILEVVRATPDCTLDGLMLRLSGASWSEVFLEVHRLNRSGQLRLTKSRSGLRIRLRAL